MGLRWERLCSAVPGFVRALRVSQRRFGAPYSYPVGTTQSIPAGYPDGSKCPLSDRNPDIRTPSSPRPDPAESCHSCSISLNDGYGAQAAVRRQSPRRAVLGGKQSLNVGFMGEISAKPTQRRKAPAWDDDAGAARRPPRRAQALASRPCTAQQQSLAALRLIICAPGGDLDLAQGGGAGIAVFECCLWYRPFRHSGPVSPAGSSFDAALRSGGQAAHTFGRALNTVELAGYLVRLRKVARL